jgi:hypothetical protein
VLGLFRIALTGSVSTYKKRDLRVRYLGVDAGLVGEGAEPSDGIVEGNVDLHGLGDHVLYFFQLVQVVLARDVVVIRDNHACEETTKRLFPSVWPYIYSQEFC